MAGQIAFMIYEYCRVTGTHGPLLDFSHLMRVTLRGDDVLSLDTRQDEVLFSIHEMPSDSILESFFFLEKVVLESLISSK